MGCGRDEEKREHYQHLEEADREATLAGQQDKAQEADARAVEIQEEELSRKDRE